MTTKTRERAETLTAKRLPTQLQRPGEYRDPTCPGLGLRVSPKLKAVWFVRVVHRVKGPDRSEKREWKRERVGEPPPLGSPADGVKWLSLVQAQAKAREMLAESRLSEIEKTRLATRRGATLRELLDDKGDPHRPLHFFRDRQVRGRNTPLAPATVRFYREVYEQHLQAVADWPLVEFQGEIVQWKSVVTRIPSRARAMGALSLLSAVYDYLTQLGLVERNPMQRVRRVSQVSAPPPKTSRVEVLDLPRFVEQLRRQRRRSRTAVEVGVLSGMRRTAFLGMRWEHLDLDVGLLKVVPGTPGWKGWHGAFPLSGRVCAMLREWKGHTPASEWVFPARHGRHKGRGHQRDVRSSLQRACEGLDFVLPTHGLRRTFSALVDLLYPGQVQLLGALLAHKWALPTMPEAEITVRYLSHHRRLRRALDRVAQLYAEVLGEVPMSDATRHALARADVNLEALTLPSHDEPDDSDDDEWLEDKDEDELAA